MKHAFILLISILFIECSDQHKPSDIYSYLVDVDKAIASNFFTVVDSVHFIALETTKNNLIGEITQLTILDRIILSDSRTNQLMLFSLEGKSQFVLSQTGNGPGEYVRLDAFSVDSDNKEIIILDAMQNKVITYSETGAFLREKVTPLPYGPGAFERLVDSGSYVFEQSISSVLAESKYNLFICPKNVINPTKLLPFEKTSSVTFSPRVIFYSINDTLVYVPTYNNTIYNVFDDRVEPRIKMDFGNKWVKDEYIYNPTNESNPRGFVEGLENQSFVYFFNLLESNTHIYSDFYYRGFPYIYLHNKQLKTDFVLKAKDKEGFGFRGKPLCTNNDRFVISITPSELKELLNNPSIQFPQKEDVIRQFKNLSEESNPIIMSVKFK